MALSVDILVKVTHYSRSFKVAFTSQRTPYLSTAKRIFRKFDANEKKFSNYNNSF